MAIAGISPLSIVLGGLVLVLVLYRQQVLKALSFLADSAHGLADSYNSSYIDEKDETHGAESKEDTAADGQSS